VGQLEPGMVELVVTEGDDHSRQLSRLGAANQPPTMRRQAAES